MKNSTKTVVFAMLSLLLIASIAQAQPVSGLVTVAADPSAQGDATYPSLQALFEDIKANDLGGDLTVELEDLFTVENLEIDNVGDTAGVGDYTITIRPVAGATGVIFNGYTYVQGGGTHNIVFDGRPGGEGEEGAMTFRQQDNTAADAIFFRAGANNLTVRYTKFEADSRWMIRCQFSQGNAIVENNEFTTFNTGYQGDGGSEYFRTLFFTGNVYLRNNLMHGLQSKADAPEAVAVFLATPASWQGALGSQPYTKEVVNNVIEITKSPGVKFAGGIRLNVRNGQVKDDVFKAYHNTIIIKGAENTYNESDGITFGIAKDAKGRNVPSQIFDVKNNIIVNEIANADGVDAAKTGAIWLASNDIDFDGESEQINDSTLAYDSTDYIFQYNNVVLSGDAYAILGPDDSSDPDQTVLPALSDWQDLAEGLGTGTTQEVPNFTDPTSTPPNYSLDIDPLSATWQAGVSVDVANDLLGNPRKITPTKGAYELAGILEGVLTVAADPNDKGNNTYASLQEAFEDIAIKGFKDNIILELEDLFTVENLEIDNFGHPTFTTTIRPQLGAAGVIFNGTTYVQGGGTENIVFDGRPGGEGNEGVMIFRQQDNTASDAIFFRAGANNLTVMYSKFEADSRWMIRSQFSQGNAVVENNEFTTFNTGYQGDGGSEYFRTLFFTGNVYLRNNLMHGLQSKSDASEAVAVFLATPAPWQGALGNQPYTKEIVNNTIEITKAPGVKFSGGIRLNVRNGQVTGDEFKAYHNTIIVKGEANTYNQANGITFGIAKDGNGRNIPSQLFDVRNNIIVNEITNADGVDSARVANFWIASNDPDLDGSAASPDAYDSTTYIFDYNNIDSQAPIWAVLGPDDSSNPAQTVLSTLVDWQTAGQGANTTTETVTFTDASNDQPDYSLDLEGQDDATWYIGTGLEISTDLAGNNRPADGPTKGAYEAEIITGFDNLVDISSRVTVFPNPSQDIFQIDMEHVLSPNVGLQLFTISGQLVNDYSFESIGKSKLSLNLSGLRSGIYILRVVDEVNIAELKLIKSY